MRKRRDQEKELEVVVVEGKGLETNLVDYNNILRMMTQTPLGELGCVGNALVLLGLSLLCSGATFVYSLLNQVAR